MSLENKKLTKYLQRLLTAASKNQKYSEFRKDKKFFEGEVTPTIGYSYGMDPRKGVNRNYYNVIRPIIETKATIALDSQISTFVKPTRMSNANYQYLKEVDLVADVLNDVWESVKTQNNLKTIEQQIVRDGLVYGVGIAQTAWDSEMEQGLGNVSIKRISPLDFFPEPEATSVKNANYIFVKRRLSKFDLINKYKNDPRVMEILDKISKSNDAEFKDEEETNILQGYENTKDAGQAYLRKGDGLPHSTTSNYTIYECYLKDDTIFYPAKDDSSDVEDIKAEELFKYPYGRLIVFCGDYILEDRNIDYPFGMPFSTFTPNSTNTLVGRSDVYDLRATQQKITDAYYKLNELIMKYRSMLIVSPDSINPQDISKNFDVITAKRGALQPPILVNNKLMQDIQIIRQHIDDLKKDAMALARINEMMMSGTREVGVNSGQMVKDLLESPMSSIREIQRNFKNFLVDVSNKGITIIQLYYQQPRIMRLSGERFARINQESQFIDILDPNNNVKVDEETALNSEAIFERNVVMRIPQNLLNDLSLTRYEVTVQTGAALPQSASAIAATTIQLAQQGILGDINSIDTKEIILQALDYPNYRAIIQKMKEEQEAAVAVQGEPSFADYLKNVSISLGDILDLVGTLSPQVQESAIFSISNALGLTNSTPDTGMSIEDPDFDPPNIEGTIPGGPPVNLSFN